MPVVREPTQQLYLGREVATGDGTFSDGLFDFFVTPIADPFSSPVSAVPHRQKDTTEIAGLVGAPTRLVLERKDGAPEGSKTEAAGKEVEIEGGKCVFQGQQSPGFEGIAYSFKPAMRCDLAVGLRKWSSSIVGSVSPWIVTDLHHSTDAYSEGLKLVDAHHLPVADPLQGIFDFSPKGIEGRNQFCCEALNRELLWAAHCSMFAVVCPIPRTGRFCPNYANVIRATISRTVTTQVWIRLPLSFARPESPAKSLPGQEESNSEHRAALPAPCGASENAKELAVSDPWQVWNQIRMICGHSPNIGVVLDFTSKLPDDPNEISRWISEPVKAVALRTSLFLFNSQGFPVLPRRHKALLIRLFRYNVQVILQDDVESSDNHTVAINPPKAQPPNVADPTQFPQLSAATADGHTPSKGADTPIVSTSSSGSATPTSSRLLEACRDYVVHLCQSLPPLTSQEGYCAPYWDYLQSPLQPLQDDLESQTYEIFEKDPVKYVQYEKAIAAALVDRMKAGKQRHVIMVVGAGRGPLVSAALAAMDSVGIQADASCIYAIEKNVNAVVTLQGRVSNDQNPRWRDVCVVGCDMRFWTAPELADILVSELLGSFGDNELSPECLDGAQRFLHADGISIPTRYISALEPVSTYKLWNDCKALENSPSVGSGESIAKNPLESTYVVHFHAFYTLSKEQPKLCFEFIHPNRNIPDLTSNSHNNRYAKLTFTAKSDGLLHGFAGYFHCDLYKDIHISILPSTFSEGMFSWFPLYLPVREPLYVAKDELITVHIWRQDDAHKVWYEWCMTSPTPTRMHNAGGRSCPIGK